VVSGHWGGLTMAAMISGSGVRRTAIVATAVVACALVALPSANGASTPKWRVISTVNVNTTGTTPSIAKFGNEYEAVWVERIGSSNPKFSLIGRRLNAAGKPLGPAISIVKDWVGIQGDPTILSLGKERIVAFGGDKSVSASPYNDGAEFYSTSTDGIHWTLNTGSLSAEDLADRNTGTAVINDNGTLITALSVDDGVRYHVGASTSNPASGTDKLSATTGNDSYDAGLGVDAKSHKVWALWYSNSGVNGKDGVNAQVIYPKVEPRVHAPGSSNPVTKSFGVQQDLSGASRVGGGVYTAYGTPNVQAIDVWKLGAKKPFATIKDHTGVSSMVLRPAPKGRLWLYWRDSQGWRATRSNRSATKFGPVITIKIPNPSHVLTSNIFIAGTGSAGPLEAIATLTTLTNVNEILATQVLPRLTVRAAPHSVKRGHSFTVTVTDAGDPVKAAVVHFDGGKKKTNKHGKVTLKVPHGAKPGKYAVTFGLGGYAGARTSVVVSK
jgi:hypothetical protein